MFYICSDCGLPRTLFVNRIRLLPLPPPAACPVCPKRLWLACSTIGAPARVARYLSENRSAAPSPPSARSPAADAPPGCREATRPICPKPTRAVSCPAGPAAWPPAHLSETCGVAPLAATGCITWPAPPAYLSETLTFAPGAKNRVPRASRPLAGELEGTASPQPNPRRPRYRSRIGVSPCRAAARASVLSAFVASRKAFTSASQVASPLATA